MTDLKPEVKSHWKHNPVMIKDYNEAISNVLNNLNNLVHEAGKAGIHFRVGCYRDTHFIESTNLES